MNCNCRQCRRRAALRSAINLAGSILFTLLVGALCYAAIALMFLLPD
jgi:hypothetical protein